MNAQRQYDNQTPETIDPPPRRYTLAEQEVEGASKGTCMCCGEWKVIPAFQHVCKECFEI